jgi:hypothetical protein
MGEGMGAVSQWYGVHNPERRRPQKKLSLSLNWKHGTDELHRHYRYFEELMFCHSSIMPTWFQVAD